jgi:hypothetical protein
MIYVLILLTFNSHATSSASYDFTSLENCQKALAAIKEQVNTAWHVAYAYGVCVQK